MIHLFLIGLISILGQVVLLREMAVAFYGIELIYSLALGIWLLWTALGATISRRKLEPSALGVGLLFLAFAVLLPLDIAFIRSIRLVFAGVPGAYLPFHSQMIALSISLLPVGLLLGWLFQWAAKRYMSGGRSLATAYAIESLGGLAGGILATLFLRYGTQNFATGLMCALASLVAVFLLERSERRAWLTVLASISAVTLLLSWRQAPILDRWMSAWTHPNLLETSDSPYGRITLAGSGGQVALFENDALSFTTEGTEAEELANLAAVQHPRPDRVLILGGGIEGTVAEVLKHSPQIVDYVELNPVVLRSARLHLPQEFRQPLDAHNVHLTFADPRRFLTTRKSYDLIIAGLPEPASGQNNRFYTVEFFEQCSNRLAAGGILAFRLKSSENLWTPQLTRRTVSIYKAVKSVFPDVVVLPGSANIFIASRDPLTTDYSILADRLRERRVQAKLVSPAYIRYLYTNDRFAEIAKILASGDAPANTDARPICYQYTLMIWLSKFFPSLAIPDLASLLHPTRTQSVGWAVLVLGFLALVYLLGRRLSISRVLLVGFAGFIGMVLETLLLLHYQVKRGILYQDVGILLRSFMAGLALGAVAIQRWFSSHSGRWRAAALPAGFAALAATTGLYVNFEPGAGLSVTSGLLALAGFLVAGMFAQASLLNVADQREAVTPLYAADLAGGCLGSLAASLLLVPVTGLFAAALAMVPLSIVTLLVLRQPSK